MELQGAGYFLLLFVVVVAHSALAARWRMPLLLGASLVFYSFSSVAYLGLFLVVSTVNYLVVLKLSRSEDGRVRSIVFGAVVALDLLVLAFFKYWSQLMQAWLDHAALSALQSGAFEIAAPLGISYFTFQMIACATDAYRRDWAPDGKWSDFTLFSVFFPQITSGPIPRASRLLPQLSGGARASAEDREIGLRLIAYGLFKKYVVANRLNDYVTEIFAAPDPGSLLHYSTLPTLVGCIYNVLNLYADFSSYVDIAMGSARLLGIRLDPNFDRPFTSTSITELWRRWHMTLSFWLRDYLFMPLLIRIGELGSAGVVIALIVTFAICGVWHGASWTFLCFGVSQGVAMSLEALTRRWRNRRIKQAPPRLIKLTAWVYTMGFFALSEVFFRASNLSNAGAVYSRLFHVEMIQSAAELFAHKGPFDFSLGLVAVALWFAIARAFRRESAVSTPVFALICALLVMFLGHLGNGRFIYAGF